MHPSQLFVCLFVCLYFERSHDQADAYPKAFLYPGFNSIRKTHVCHRLQPHLYPGLIGIRLGRDVEPDCDISQRMSSSTPLSEPEIIDEIKVADSQGWTHIENPTRLSLSDPDWDYMIFLGNNSPGMWLKNVTRAPGLPIIRSVKSADCHIIDSQTRCLHVECAPPLVQFSKLGYFPLVVDWPGWTGHISGTLCTDDNILSSSYLKMPPIQAGDLSCGW